MSILLIRCLHTPRLVKDLVVDQVHVTEAGVDIVNAAVPHLEDKAQSVWERFVVHGVEAKDDCRKSNNARSVLEEMELLDCDLGEVGAEVLELLANSKERDDATNEGVWCHRREIEAQSIQDHGFHMEKLKLGYIVLGSGSSGQQDEGFLGSPRWMSRCCL